MKRTGKILIALLLICAVAAVLPGPIGAAQAAPAGEASSLTVIPGSQEELSDLAGAGVVVDLYQVASAAREGSGYAYTLGERYAGLREGLDQVLTTPVGEALEALSELAAQAALGGGDRAVPTVEGAPAGSAVGGIEPGLYLVVVRGSRPERYLGTIKGANGRDIIVSRVQTGNWLYTYLPRLVFLPGKPVDAHGHNSPANPGGWLFNVRMTLKPTRENGRLGSLEIVKTLTDFVADHQGFFVFKVDVYVGGELISSTLYNMIFDQAGQQRITVPDLPEGAEVVVTEEYSGASYRLTTAGMVRGTISAGEVLQAEFTNTGSTGDGGAIINHFNFEDEGGWVWTPIPVIE